MRWSSAQQSTWSRTAKGSQRPQDNWRLPRSKRASCGAYYTMRDGNIIAIEGPAMTRVAHTSDQLNFTRIVINAKSVGLTPDQFVRLCSDNPELEFELTARKEIVIMPPCTS